MNLNELNALTLSCGGSSGAFGAGFLAGWADTGGRPKFDIATGISAGALIAPFAFLGPDYDEELRIGFTTVKDSQIYTRRGEQVALGSRALEIPIVLLERPGDLTTSKS